MPQFTLDYTQHPSSVRTRSKRSLSARIFLFFVGWSVLSPVIVVMLLALLFHSHHKHQKLDHQHRVHLVRYDSLLAAKQEADRQLLKLLSKPSASKITQSR